MRIEIAPWRHVETSLSTSESPEEDSAFVRAAFVESLPHLKRGSSRKRRAMMKEDEEDDMVEKERRRPLLTVTTARQAITIVDDEDRLLNPLQESALLSYRCRPGASFISPLRPSNGDLSTLPCIPAIYDARHHRCFAVQKKNMQLISFSQEESSELSFESAIFSLSILHLPRISRSIVYGTCANGKFFMAECEPSETGKVPLLRVHFWDAPARPDRSVHLYTTAACIPASSSAASLYVVVDQLFYTESGIVTVARQYLAMDPQTMDLTYVDASSSYANVCTQRSLPLPDTLKTSQVLVSDVRVLGYVSTSNEMLKDSFVVCYRVRSCAYPLKNGSHFKTMPIPPKEQCSSYFYTCISLSNTCSHLSQAQVLPSSSRHFSVISSNMLAVITQQNELYIYDALRGGIVLRDRLPLPEQAARPLQCLSLRSQLAIVYSKGSRFWVATTSIGRVARKNPPSSLSLASGLAASLSVPSLPDFAINVAISRTLCPDEPCRSNNIAFQEQSKQTKCRNFNLLLRFFSNRTHQMYLFLLFSNYDAQSHFHANL
jgi:hypothetical protein